MKELKNLRQPCHKSNKPNRFRTFPLMQMMNFGLPFSAKFTGNGEIDIIRKLTVATSLPGGLQGLKKLVQENHPPPRGCEIFLGVVTKPAKRKMPQCDGSF